MSTNLRYYAAAVVLIAAISTCFMVFAGDNDGIVSFLGEYGYEVSQRPIESAEIKIPKPLDMVYKGYNELQKKAGFDLEPYEGKSVMRYTYKIKNYPGDIDGVRANVLVSDGKIIGGDICTVRLDGFMHEIKSVES